jgi:ADP-ribose pyrophosphatase YjhB (NUDIX family)
VTEPTWLSLARELQAIAQTGLHYAKDPFDVERYARTREIAAAMMAAGSGEPAPRILELFKQDVGYMTPRVDVRGAVFRDGEILLVREVNDGRWSMPGGWADVNGSPVECIEREIHEESGYVARAAKLAAVWDRRRHAHHPPHPGHIYKLFFLCTLIGGTAQPSLETSAAQFFAEGALPELSMSRVTDAQIRRMFVHHRQPDLPTDFE